MPPAQSDAASVITTRSNRTIQYQCLGILLFIFSSWPKVCFQSKL
jgi:hypothetical protein